jgi:hypothetical protein
LATANSVWLNGQASVRDERLGVTFDQPWRVGVGTPDLSSSRVEVDRMARSGLAASGQLVLRNTGLAPTTGGHAVGVLPLGTQVLTDSIKVTGSGTAAAAGDSLTWEGTLSPGEESIVSFQVLTPETLTSQDLPLELLAWDGLGGAWEWRRWLRVWNGLTFLPLLSHP